MQQVDPIRTLQAKYADAKPMSYDPSPTRMEYRAQRLWLSPFFRALVRKGIPAFAIAFFGLQYFMDSGNRQSINTAMMTAAQTVQNRPEYMINSIDIHGASAELAVELEAELKVDFPASTYDIDLDAVRADLEDLPGVDAAVLRVKPGGALDVTVTEVPAVALWRTMDGLKMLSGDGVELRSVTARRDYPDLPLIAGDGAQNLVPEALELFAEATPIQGALRGMVRVGERRWDLILAGDQRISLPEKDPSVALKQILILAQTKDLLARHITVVDYRNPRRPTIRLASGATESVQNTTPASQTGTSQ